jgi:hypothetical protein
VGGGAALISVTATANAGAQTIHSTSTSDVSVTATANGALQTITTGAGDDTIVVGSSASDGKINAGAGADKITLGATHTGIDQVTVTLGQSTQAAMDTITNFSLVVSDILELGSTTLLDTSQLGGGFTVVNGIATGGVLVDFLAAATASTTAGIVSFNDILTDSNYVVASDGLASGAFDTVVQLIGISDATAVGTAAGPSMIHIV